MDENFRNATKTSSEHRQFSPFKFVYFISGVVLILALPTAIFCILEGWTKVFILTFLLPSSFKLESFYFSIISLSTIGFGDYIPRNTPPNSMGLFQVIVTPQ